MDTLIDLNSSILKAFNYVVNIYNQGKTILNDLERIILKNGFSNIPKKNFSGAKGSKSFDSITSNWIPHFVSRWYGFTDDHYNNLTLGTSIIFYEPDRGANFKPFLLIGLFETKDIHKYPERKRYDWEWLYDAWYNSGEKEKKFDTIYLVKCQYGEDSYFWYNTVKLLATELVQIKSTKQIYHLVVQIVENTMLKDIITNVKE